MKRNYDVLLNQEPAFIGKSLDQIDMICKKNLDGDIVLDVNPSITMSNKNYF